MTAGRTVGFTQPTRWEAAREFPLSSAGDLLACGTCIRAISNKLGADSTEYP